MKASRLLVENYSPGEMAAREFAYHQTEGVAAPVVEVELTDRKE
jgi:hypothetical protein